MLLNICQIHKTQSAIFNDKKNHSQSSKLCLMCIQNLDSEIINFQDIQQHVINFYSQSINKKYTLNQKNIYFLIDVKQSLQDLKVLFENSIDKQIEWLNQQIINLTVSQAPEELFQKIKIIDLNSIVEEEQKIQKYFQNFKDIKKSFLDNIAYLFKGLFIKSIKDTIDKIYLGFENLSTTQIKEHEIEKAQKFENTLDIQKLEDFSIKSVQECCAMAFNMDSSIVIVGCRQQIRIYKFLKGYMNQIQIISNKHTNNVWTLNFMKKQNGFISGSYDNSIIIWMSKNNQYICQQKLENHISNVYCLVLNVNEDLIVSGSDDKTIRFWIEKDKWLCQQVITDHTDSVFALSINEQSNRLISCSYDKSILVIEKSVSLLRWVTIQKIQVEQFGCRLCFINDNQFTFQPQTKEYLHLFEMNSISKQYHKVKDIDVKCGSDGSCLFPQQFIKLKGLLLNKNGQNINLMRQKQNADLKTDQSIDFGTDQVFGKLSDDGKYLITWDNKSQEIQIRELKEI